MVIGPAVFYNWTLLVVRLGTITAITNATTVLVAVPVLSVNPILPPLTTTTSTITASRLKNMGRVIVTGPMAF